MNEVRIAQRRQKLVAVPSRKVKKSGTELLESAKTRGLMQVIERIVAKDHRGEVVLDNDTYRLYEIAKSIKWAENDEQFLDAIRRLE